MLYRMVLLQDGHLKTNSLFNIYIKERLQDLSFFCFCTLTASSFKGKYILSASTQTGLSPFIGSYEPKNL